MLLQSFWWSAAAAMSPVIFCSSVAIFASLASSLAGITFIMCCSKAKLSVLALTCYIYELVSPIWPEYPFLDVVNLVENCCALWSSIFTRSHVLLAASRPWKISFPLRSRLIFSMEAMSESQFSLLVVTMFSLDR